MRTRGVALLALAAAVVVWGSSGCVTLRRTPEARFFVLRSLAEPSPRSPEGVTGVVGVHDIGEDDGQVYFAMDYVAGGSLDHLIAAESIGPEEAAGVIMQAARAVRFFADHFNFKGNPPVQGHCWGIHQRKR